MEQPFANVGQVYNVYSKGESDLYTFNFSTGFDIVPGSSEKGRHTVQFGVIYEQSVDRGYVLRPYELWRCRSFGKQPTFTRGS